MAASVLSSKLKDYRKNHSMTEKQLADLLGISVEDVSKWESGNVYPNKKEMMRISEILDLPLELLLNDDPENKKKVHIILKIAIPCLILIIFIMTIFIFSSQKTINKQQTQINSQKSQMQKLQKENDKLYNYSVTFVLAPQTPYNDFKEYIEQNYDVGEVSVSNDDYVIIHFQMKSHNNDDANFLFNEIKDHAPKLNNSDLSMVIS